MQLKRPLPPNRTYEQVLNHYLVEKSLATRLKTSTREQRSLILNTMYEELFRKVPDHPRLFRRQDEGATYRAMNKKMALISRFLGGVSNCAEFAPGDCRFAMRLARSLDQVYGIDISDQRNPDDAVPNNFHLIVYDGYAVGKPDPGSLDLIFSDQLIEHLHPEDTKLHFELALRLLKPGGMYVFRTPHALTGPHDVSMYFSDVAEGFHLKEWTYVEIRSLLLAVGYTALRCYRLAGQKSLRIPFTYLAAAEFALKKIPHNITRPLARYLISSVYAAAVK